MAAAKKPPPHPHTHPHPHPHPHPRPLRGVIPPPILKPWGGGGGGSRGVGETERGLEELREKLMGHLREAADRMELASSPSSASSPSTAAPEDEPTPHPHPPPPWNLRARRGGGVAAAERKECPEGGRRARFSLELTAEEIQADIYALTESRPRRRPRKRPRIVQRQLDSLFPGMWLSEVSVDLYKVPDE